MKTICWYCEEEKDCWMTDWDTVCRECMGEQKNIWCIIFVASLCIIAWMFYFIVYKWL